MKRLLFLFLSFSLVAADTRVFACTGNEYWPDTPVWINRNEIELTQFTQISDYLLRAALVRSGVTPCPVVEKDLLSSSMKVPRAIRSIASPVTRQKGFSNYDEITQVMIRQVLRPNEYGVLEVLTRTKIREAGQSDFVAASPGYQSNAAQLADKITEILTALLSR